MLNKIMDCFAVAFFLVCITPLVAVLVLATAATQGLFALGLIVVGGTLYLVGRVLKKFGAS